MIDVSKEPLVVLSKARFPNRPHASTIWRWANRGVRGVLLESVLIGGQRYTSQAAVERFIDRSNAPSARVAAAG